MWSRLRRRTMAPRRPVLYPRQVPLAVLSVAVLLVFAAVAVYLILR